MARPWLASTLLFGPALAWSLAAVAGLVWTGADASAWTELDRHGDPVAGSDSCRSCHPAQWQTWHRSWHRTMTQRPEPASLGPLALAVDPAPEAEAEGETGQAGVLAPFAGEQLDYGGFRATMDRGADGVPRVLVERLDDAGEAVVGAPVLDAAVALSVGSHRYQQYLAYLDRGGGEGELHRLPVAWHRAERRWIHMNGAFVEPEGEDGSLADYERHLSRWNDNCIFCHNTEAVPGLDPGSAGFRSELGELGIACEACHGPAQAHIDRHRGNPLRRLLASSERGTDGSIANPATLGPARESEICGRCHGQRIARDIAAVMREGDGFVAGDELASISRPIFADSTIAGVEGLDRGRPFAARFWPDGTPRLSAYEYQGLLLSPCWSEGEGLGCGHCHDMHGDAPDGQLRAGRTGQGACVDCHRADELGGAEQLGGHGGHGEAVDCLGCHMPRISYGLLEGMITHRISSPDPAAWIGRGDQPDACTQCHVDRSREWAARSMSALGLRGSPIVARPHADEAAASRVVLDLLGGDPIQRNLAAHALARPGATASLDARAAWIADGLEDEYPSVRWFAWRGLRSLAERMAPNARRAALLAALERFDYLGPIDERVEVVTRIRALVGPAPLTDDPELRERLLSERQALAIWIGE
ncbi:Dissimilatory sulfite reductase [Enhygromyxa salina]|uniref:Dissimilatory sulfite reductase n=1 Tax=Enhygromyxa salina TaxID=215803 RepID=A0A2S9YI63_9BACT|nr:cytochrome c3 family protein [Enhygromyxa salina]PRQ04706.1 Dissimilatory sulfite reductase [Enhygromyxa salina]